MLTRSFSLLLDCNYFIDLFMSIQSALFLLLSFKHILYASSSIYDVKVSQNTPELAPNQELYAIVTLVTGYQSGYVSGAIALAQSLKNVNSSLPRIVMVTPEVEKEARERMSFLFHEIIEVSPIPCNHKLSSDLNPSEYNLNGEKYKAGVARWASTCTKFAAWKLTQFKRVLFMDADMLVLLPIDDLLLSSSSSSSSSSFSNASLVAAPETFPPDTFNSGLMLIRPSLETFQELLECNDFTGSAEGTVLYHS